MKYPDLPEPAIAEWHYIEEEGEPVAEGMYHLTVLSGTKDSRPSERKVHVETDFFDVKGARQDGRKPGFRRDWHNLSRIIAWCPFPEPAPVSEEQIKEIIRKQMEER